MAYAYALLDDDEALRALNQDGVDSPRWDHINDARFAASEEIQNDLERIVIQASWIEYHERSRVDSTVLRVLHWPISSISEIAEDSNRDYGSSTVLTVNTDYQIINEGDHTAKIRRISSDSPTSWLSGFEAIRIKVTGGWTLANVPRPIKRVCAQYLARIYRETATQEHGFETITDARGSFKYSVPVMLTKPMLSTLAEYKDFGATTCVRFTLDSS